VVWWLVCLRMAVRVVCGGLDSDLDLDLDLARDWAAAEVSHTAASVFALAPGSAVWICSADFADGLVDGESKEVVASHMDEYIAAAVVAAYY